MEVQRGPGQPTARPGLAGTPGPRPSPQSTAPSQKRPRQTAERVPTSVGGRLAPSPSPRQKRTELDIGGRGKPGIHEYVEIKPHDLEPPAGRRRNHREMGKYLERNENSHLTPKLMSSSKGCVKTDAYDSECSSRTPCHCPLPRPRRTLRASCLSEGERLCLRPAADGMAEDGDPGPPRLWSAGSMSPRTAEFWLSRSPATEGKSCQDHPERGTGGRWAPPPAHRWLPGRLGAMT